MAIHGRINATSPVILAGLCFLIFAPIEIVASFVFHNSAIAGNASHDAFDGLAFIVFGKIESRMLQSIRHEIYCRLRGYFNIVIALVAVIFVGVGLAFETSNDAGSSQMVAALVLGPISFALNWYWERKLAGHIGFNVHLLGDMVGSVIVTVCGILAYKFSYGHLNRIGGFLILSATLVIAIAGVREIVKEINHSEEQHPVKKDDHDHAGHHHH